jgi:hypothetical protein
MQMRSSQCCLIYTGSAAWIYRVLWFVLQVRRAVLHFLPKLPVLSTGSSDAAGQSGMQYPMAEPLPPLVPAPKHDAVTAGTQQQQQTPQQQEQPKQAGQQALQKNDAGGSSSSSSSASGGSIAELLRPLGPCPICNTGDILVPFVAHPCRHVFCYYCLQSHCAADSEFACPVDGVRVDALQRYVRTVPVAPA